MSTLPSPSALDEKTLNSDNVNTREDVDTERQRSPSVKYDDNYPNGNLRRGLKARHVQFIAIGGAPL